MIYFRTEKVYIYREDYIDTKIRKLIQTNSNSCKVTYQQLSEAKYDIDKQESITGPKKPNKWQQTDKHMHVQKIHLQTPLSK